MKPDGTHKIFSSETALDYPPDNARFLIFMTKIIKDGISFIEELISSIDIDYEILCNPKLGEKLLLGITAGKTNFEFIKK